MKRTNIDLGVRTQNISQLKKQFVRVYFMFIKHSETRSKAILNSKRKLRIEGAKRSF